jgi:hypothetical protein
MLRHSEISLCPIQLDWYLHAVADMTSKGKRWKYNTCFHPLLHSCKVYGTEYHMAFSSFVGLEVPFIPRRFI